MDELAHVVADGARADAEDFADLLVGEALPEAAEDAALLRGHVGGEGRLFPQGGKVFAVHTGGGDGKALIAPDEGPRLRDMDVREKPPSGAEPIDEGAPLAAGVPVPGKPPRGKFGGSAVPGVLLLHDEILHMEQRAAFVLLFPFPPPGEKLRPFEVFFPVRADPAEIHVVRPAKQLRQRRAFFVERAQEMRCALAQFRPVHSICSLLLFVCISMIRVSLV